MAKKQMENNETKSNMDARETILQGFYIDPMSEKLEKVDFEVTIPYARAPQKHIDAVKKHFNLDASAAVVIVNVEQPETERKFYSESALFMADAETFIDENEAKTYARENGLRVVAANIYGYETQVFAVDNKGDYFTEKFTWVCGDNWTKRDARAALAMRYEETHACKVIALHSIESPQGFTKKQDSVWYAISADELAKCERTVRHRESK